MYIKKILYSFILSGSLLTVNAAEMTHKFVNPNFGGNPFNASPLLSNANAQNTHKAPVSATASSTSSQAFKERLDRAIFSRLSRQLVESAFGDNGEILEGTIETGLNTIAVEETDNGSIVTITDSTTGDTTVIEVPSFN